METRRRGVVVLVVENRYAHHPLGVRVRRAGLCEVRLGAYLRGVGKVRGFELRRHLTLPLVASVLEPNLHLRLRQMQVRRQPRSL